MVFFCCITRSVICSHWHGLVRCRGAHQIKSKEKEGRNTLQEKTMLKKRMKEQIHKIKQKSKGENIT